MPSWNGHERRHDDAGDVRSRVRALEVYREGHAERLTYLTETIEETNQKLDVITDRLTEIKIQQRVTHSIASFIGAVGGVLAGHFWKGA